MFKSIGALVVCGFAAYGVIRFVEEHVHVGEDDGAQSFDDEDEAVSRRRAFDVVK